jgi:hypothetical protein
MIRFLCRTHVINLPKSRACFIGTVKVQEGQPR